MHSSAFWKDAAVNGIHTHTELESLHITLSYAGTAGGCRHMGRGLSKLPQLPAPAPPGRLIPPLLSHPNPSPRSPPRSHVPPAPAVACQSRRSTDTADHAATPATLRLGNRPMQHLLPHTRSKTDCCRTLHPDTVSCQIPVAAREGRRSQGGPPQPGRAAAAREGRRSQGTPSQVPPHAHRLPEGRCRRLPHWALSLACPPCPA